MTLCGGLRVYVYRFAFTGIGLMFVERWGRRTLTLLSLVSAVDLAAATCTCTLAYLLFCLAPSL